MKPYLQNEVNETFYAYSFGGLKVSKDVKLNFVELEGKPCIEWQVKIRGINYGQAVTYDDKLEPYSDDPNAFVKIIAVTLAMNALQSIVLIQAGSYSPAIQDAISHVNHKEITGAIKNAKQAKTGPR